MIGRGRQYSGPHYGGTLVRTTRLVVAIRIIALWKTNFWRSTTRGIQALVPPQPKPNLIASLHVSDRTPATTQHNRNNLRFQDVTPRFLSYVLNV